MFPLLCLFLIAPLVASGPLDTLQDDTSLNSGSATYYWQNGNAGACGNINQDSDMVCAISQGFNSCNQNIQVTNLDNGRTVTVTVADNCPSCGDNIIDLSVGAFKALQDTPDLLVGTLNNIKWE